MVKCDAHYSVQVQSAIYRCDVALGRTAAVKPTDSAEEPGPLPLVDDPAPNMEAEPSGDTFAQDNDRLLTVLCCICRQECEGAHVCFVCNRAVHAICGQPLNDDDEGYGRPIVCTECMK
jgi:hypothetical protein